MRLSNIDLSDPDNYLNGPPHELFQLLRREAPVFWQVEEDGAGFWAVTKYDDVVQISKDPKLFSSEIGAVYLEEMNPSQLAARRSMLETDPPQHTLLRNLIKRDFLPASVHEYEYLIRHIAKELLEKAFAKEQFDFVHEVAGNLTMGVVAAMLGIPRDDMEELIQWTNEMVGNSDPEYSTRLLDRNDQSFKELPMRSETALKVFEYALRVKDEKLKEPGTDILSKLVHKTIEGRPLNQQEYLMYFVLLLLAGNETNRSTMSHGLVALKQHPQQLGMLQEDNELLGSALEEILRWSTPVYYFRRTATRETTLRGKKILAGDKVVMWYMSANFDEEIFEDPYRFDITREDNRHLVFGGGGPHFCLGAPLARMELKIIFEEILPHIDRLEIVAPIEYMRSNHFHALKHLQVRYS